MPLLKQTIALAALLAAVTACSGGKAPPPAGPGVAHEGDDRMMIIQIEGPIGEIRKLNKMPGVRLQSGVHPRGGDNYAIYATVTRDEAVDEIRARGLTVIVTMDKDEVQRRSQADRDLMKAALPDGGKDEDK
jgi:hypothetical protein